MNRIIKILVLLFLISCQHEKFDEERIIGIGKELTQTKFTQTDSTQIPDLIIVGNSLRKKLSELKENEAEFELVIKEGDFEEPYGDHEADAILTIITDSDNIGIRMKYDKTKNQYHILGWKSLDNPK